MTKKCLISQTKKLRVSGNNGPRRHELKEYEVVANNVPMEVIDQILNIAKKYNENDLRGDNYQISQHCDVDKAFTSSLTYKQILLQQLSKNADNEIDETQYNDWRKDIDVEIIRNYLEKTFQKPYRARISIMPPGNELNYHIDTDTSVLCRIQIPAKTNNSLFQWKTKTSQIDLNMSLGNAYFVNTGWLHRVVNFSNEERIVLIFGIDYNNIPKKEKLLL